MIRQRRSTGGLLAWGFMIGSLPACMLTPTDEQAVCGQDAVVTFAGYTLTPNQAVSLAVSRTSTGTFTPFASATTSASPTTVNGQALYFWSTPALVPSSSWAYHAPGYESFVRASIPNFDGLVTFDTTNASGQSPIDCILDQLRRGRPATSAAINCRGTDSPIVRLSAPAVSSCPCPTSFTGDVVINDLSSAVTNRCLTTLTGNLTVTSSAPAAVSLNALTDLTGNLSLDYTTPAGTSREIDLSNLPNIDGGLTIHGTISSGGFALGLQSVGWVHGNVTIQLENARPDGTRASVSGLSTLYLVPYPFSVHLVSSGAFDPSDFMYRLTGIETMTIESLALDPAKGLPLAPPRLQLAIDLRVSYPAGLAPTPNFTLRGDLRLLQSLRTASSLTIVNDPFYPSSGAAFMRNYAALETVGGLVLEGTELTGLDLGVNALAVQSLALRNNPVFRTLVRPGLSLAAGGPITIVGNPALKQCEAVAFAAGHPGTVSGNNATPCACAASPYTGDLLIDTPVAATNNSCVSSVSGTLTIGTDERMDRVSFPVLTSIGGDAHLVYTMGDYTNHTNRRVIDLPALTSVGGDLQMEAYYSEGTPPGFDLGMNALTSVGGDIDLYARFGSFSGLAGLIDHPGSIHVHGPNLDCNGSALMVNLAHVGGRVRVEGFYQFRTFFTGLSDIGGNLEVIDVRQWGGGFALLTSVGGDVVLHPKLLEPFAHLSTVGGSVVWSDNASISGFDLSLVPTNAHGLVVTNNPSVGLDLDLHIVGSGPITIQNNPTLPTCAATNYVAAQVAGGWSGTATVTGNGAGACP